MTDEPRRKTRYRGERCTSKLTLNGVQRYSPAKYSESIRFSSYAARVLTPSPRSSGHSALASVA